MCPFLTAQSLDGEVFLFSFRHLSNCKLMVLSATSRAFLHHTHTHTHTQKQTDGCIWLHSCPVSTPLPLVWHHLFWVMWPCFISTVGTLVLNCISSVHLCTLQMLYIHDFGGKWRWHHLFKCDHFQAFSNTEETQHTYGCFIPFFSFVCFISLSLFYRRPDASFSSFPWSEINLLSITHECKDYL